MNILWLQTLLQHNHEPWVQLKTVVREAMIFLLEEKAKLETEAN